MTRAICLQCGAAKVGAFSPCPKCHYDPASGGDETLAKSLILTDHYLPKADLDFLGERIRNGLPITFPEDALQTLSSRKSPPNTSDAVAGDPRDPD